MNSRMFAAAALLGVSLIPNSASAGLPQKALVRTAHYLERYPTFRIYFRSGLECAKDWGLMRSPLLTTGDAKVAAHATKQTLHSAKRLTVEDVKSITDELLPFI